MDSKINLPSQLCCQLPVNEKITRLEQVARFSSQDAILSQRYYQTIRPLLQTYTTDSFNYFHLCQITFPCISSLNVRVTFRLPSEAISSLSDILCGLFFPEL